MDPCRDIVLPSFPSTAGSQHSSDTDQQPPWVKSDLSLSTVRRLIFTFQKHHLPPTPSLHFSRRRLFQLLWRRKRKCPNNPISKKNPSWHPTVQQLNDFIPLIVAVGFSLVYLISSQDRDNEKWIPRFTWLLSHQVRSFPPKYDNVEPLVRHLNFSNLATLLDKENF